MNQGASHAVWERRQAEIWDRIFQATEDVILHVQLSRKEKAQGVDVYDSLIGAATAVGASVVRANAARSKADFVMYLDQARMQAIEVDYWLRLVFVLQRSDPVQRDLSHIISQYSSLIGLLQQFIDHAEHEDDVIRKHNRGRKINL